MHRFKYHIYARRAGRIIGGKVDINSVDQQTYELASKGWWVASALDKNHSDGSTRGVVPIHSKFTVGATGHWLELHDLGVSKLVAGRDKVWPSLRRSAATNSSPQPPHARGLRSQNSLQSAWPSAKLAAPNFCVCSLPDSSS